MATSINRRSAHHSRLSRTPAALGRWTRDARTPSLRITPAPAELPPPDMTAPFALVQVAHPENSFQVPPKRPVIEIHPIQARQTMPFMARTTACPYLECRSSNRRCLSADPAPVTLQRQVRHCFSQEHRTCSYYRQARGLRSIPPTQAAFYTTSAAALTLLVLILLSGLG